ncbi:MAG: ASKHA domain-containing protein [Acidobacteriota bacterium]|nr:ASKHA domain-containing protein [Acidobacteriota bacterium]
MEKVTATQTGLLADALDAAGHHLPMPCRGRRTCGKCGVYVAGETVPADAHEAALLARSPQPELPGYAYRLACLCRIRGTVAVVTSSIAGVAVADVGMELVLYDGADPQSLGCAIDIGTTTVTLLLFRLGDRELLAEVSQLNHQVAFGSDVLSRIDAAATVEPARLQQVIVTQLSAMLDTAAQQAGAQATDITRLTITGNTTMLHLLAGLPVKSLGVYPFTPQTLFGETRPARDVFPDLVNAELYLPPGVSTYVGPDVVCGLLATGVGSSDQAELLVDVGTNGEMALSVGGRLWCCSTAAGPAFEGAEISAGMPALPGAIEDVWLDDDGGIGYRTIGRKRPKGICGSGLISAVNAFLDANLIDETGAMRGTAIEIGNSGIRLTQTDVRKLQLAKAAMAAGIDTLLAEAGMRAEELSVLHLAGGFGSYLSSESAAGIGLLPRTLIDRVSASGNAALTGAVLLTLSRDSRQIAEQRAARAEEVELATHPVFMDRYIEQMTFSDDDAA